MKPKIFNIYSCTNDKNGHLEKIRRLKEKMIKPQISQILEGREARRADTLNRLTKSIPL